MLRASDVAQLHERRIQIRSERLDLPKRQAELAAAEAEFAGYAQNLEWSETGIEEILARLPSRSRVNVVRGLLNKRGGLAADVANQAKSLQDAEAKHGKTLEKLNGMGEPVDVSRLDGTISAVRKRGDIPGRVRSAEQHVQDAQELTSRLFSSMHPSLPCEEDARRLQVPPQETVQRHRDRVQECERNSRETKRLCDTAEDELGRAREALDQLARSRDAVTTDELDAARQRRDDLWHLVRLQHVDNAPLSDALRGRYTDELNDLPAALDAAIAAADLLADRRFDNAEMAGRLAEVSRSVAEKEQQLATLQKEGTALSKYQAELEVQWQTLWNQAPFSPLDPDAMLEWISKRAQLLDAIETRLGATSALEIQRQEATDSRSSLLEELVALGIERSGFEADGLDVLLERGSKVLQSHQAQAQTQAQLREGVDDAQETIDSRGRELDQANEALAEWTAKWKEALTALGLATDLEPDAVAPQIDELENMRELAVTMSGLHHQRIEKIERDIEAFKSEVDELLGNVATDLLGEAPDDAVVALEKRLDEARRTRDVRDGQQQAVKKLEEQISDLEQKRQDALKSVTHLKAKAGAKTTDALQTAIDKSDALRKLETEFAETLKELGREGDGLPVETLEKECESVDIDAVIAQEDTANRDIKALQNELTDDAEVRSRARADFQAVGGDDAAARAESDRQQALTEMREAAERYARVRASAILLQWAIDRYRQEKQAPLLGRAGELFSTITGDSFSGLSVQFDDQDRAQLIGTRPDGEVVEVPGMSTGTADQLYFALRVASVEDYLERASALPFVADDLFVNFDDDRASAGFQVLGELAQKTQVLFFTHHRHLVEIARAEMEEKVSVVSLNDD